MPCHYTQKGNVWKHHSDAQKPMVDEAILQLSQLPGTNGMWYGITAECSQGCQPQVLPPFVGNQEYECAIVSTRFPYRLKAAFEKRKKHHKDSKKKGHKLHHKGKAFGKLVRDDEKVKELRESFAAAAKEHHSKVRDLHKQLKDASDEDKDGLRDQLKNLRKDWFEGMKGNREEVRTRIKEIRDEFKNKRDEVIDGNDPGE